MKHDDVADWDAAYALGALDDADRAAFEAHLAECAHCRAQVAEAGSTAGLLALVGPRGSDEVDLDQDLDLDLDGAAVAGAPMPDTLLPGLLRRAARERGRRRWVVGGLAVAAAACLAAFLVAVWPSADNPSSEPPSREQAMQTLVSTPVRATAQLTARSWGTQIDVKCRHEPHGTGGGGAELTYRLSVVDTAGHPHDAGGWGLSNSGSTDFTGGTEVPRARITKVQVRLSDGTPILQLAL